MLWGIPAEPSTNQTFLFCPIGKQLILSPFCLYIVHQWFQPPALSSLRMLPFYLSYTKVCRGMDAAVFRKLGVNVSEHLVLFILVPYNVAKGLLFMWKVFLIFPYLCGCPTFRETSSLLGEYCYLLFSSANFCQAGLIFLILILNLFVTQQAEYISDSQ